MTPDRALSAVFLAALALPAGVGLCRAAAFPEVKTWRTFPAQLEEWYLLVYLDAYEWVELPNVHGMVLFADGGMMAQ